MYVDFHVLPWRAFLTASRRGAKRGANGCQGNIKTFVEFQPTLFTRRATCAPIGPVISLLISTHALHAKSDKHLNVVTMNDTGFQPTPSTRRATFPESFRERLSFTFQPTPFTRRATRSWMDFTATASISTHALHAKGDPNYLKSSKSTPISTHALHAKGDITSRKGDAH